MATANSKESEEAGYFRQFHAEAYLYIDQAITLDETGKTLEAISLYEKGLRLLEQGLAFPCPGDEARNMRAKMNKTKEEVLARLSLLSVSSSHPEVPTEEPPSYEEACNNSNGVLKYSKSTGDLETVPLGLGDSPTDAELIFSIPSGAQIFFVNVEGYVSAPSYPTGLSIYKFKSESSPTHVPNARSPPAFLQIGEWTYPLHPGRSPVLHSSYGAYMFPDTNSSKPGAAVGLLLDEKDVDRTTLEVFEHILCELTAMREEKEVEKQADRLSSRLSDGIVQGANMLSQGVAYGAEKATHLVKLGAEKIRERISPEQQPIEVDPRVAQGAKIARSVSGAAVKLSGYFVSRLGAATMALGRHLAPHVRHHGSQLLRRFSNDSQSANSTMDGILEVASGSLQGFSTVYLSLESAAIILARSLTDQTVQLVNYRYGEKAGDTANDALYAAGNLAVTAHNVNAFGVKAIAKRTAKDAGKAMVQDFERSRKDESGNAKPEEKKPGPPQ